jgi:hypothetical protein
MLLVVDGEVVATSSSARPQFTDGALQIGGSTILNDYFDGTIDEVRVYDKALGVGEVIDDMDSAIEVPTSTERVIGLGFEQRQGATAYSLGSDHHGAIDGASWITNGKHGAALSFDGIDDEVAVADASALDFSDEMTLAAWVRPDGVGPSGSVISKQATDGTGYQLDLSGSGGVPRVRVGDGQTVYSLSAPAALPAGRWSHLAATHDGAHLRLYVNGKQAASGAAAPPAANSRDLLVGSDANGGNFAGDIDDASADDDAVGPEGVPALQRKPVGGGLSFRYLQDATGADITTLSVGAAGNVVVAEGGAGIEPGWGGVYKMKVVASGEGGISCERTFDTWAPWLTSCFGGADVPWSAVDNPPTIEYEAQVVDASDPNKVYFRSAPLTVEFYAADYEVRVTGEPRLNGKARIRALAPISDNGTGPPDLVVRDSEGDEASLCEEEIGDVTTCDLDAGRYRATLEGYGHVFGYSEWITVDGSGQVEGSLREGVDLYGLAAMYAGASTVCDAFLHWGTHTQGTSTSDQYNACSAASQTGASTVQAILAAAGVVGTAATLQYLAWYAQTYGNPATGVVDGSEDTSGPTATPAPPTAYPGTLNQDIETMQERAAGAISEARATTVLHACLVLATRNQCMKNPIFVSGSLNKVEPATAHARSAIFKKGKPFILRRRVGQMPGPWYRNRPECRPLQTGYDCDEYPMQSTLEGGPGASLLQIPRWANRSQGGSLGGFYNRCRMSHGESFIFVPALPGTGMPSTGVC